MTKTDAEKRIETAEQLLEENNMITQSMIAEKCGISNSSAVWILKKMLKQRIIMEAKQRGKYVPYKERSLDEIEEIMKQQEKEVQQDQKNTLLILYEMDETAQPMDIYDNPKIKKTKSWFTWFICKLINYGLVDYLETGRGLYRLTDKGKQFVEEKLLDE